MTNTKRTEEFESTDNRPGPSDPINGLGSALWKEGALLWQKDNSQKSRSGDGGLPQIEIVNEAFFVQHQMGKYTPPPEKYTPEEKKPGPFDRPNLPDLKAPLKENWRPTPTLGGRDEDDGLVDLAVRVLEITGFVQTVNDQDDLEAWVAGLATSKMGGAGKLWSVGDAATRQDVSIPLNPGFAIPLPYKYSSSGRVGDTPPRSRKQADDTAATRPIELTAEESLRRPVLETHGVNLRRYHQLSKTDQLMVDISLLGSVGERVTHFQLHPPHNGHLQKVEADSNDFLLDVSRRTLEHRGSNRSELNLAVARQMLAIGQPGLAVDHARCTSFGDDKPMEHCIALLIVADKTGHKDERRHALDQIDEITTKRMHQLTADKPSSLSEYKLMHNLRVVSLRERLNDAKSETEKQSLNDQLEVEQKLYERYEDRCTGKASKKDSELNSISKELKELQQCLEDPTKSSYVKTEAFAVKLETLFTRAQANAQIDERTCRILTGLVDLELLSSNPHLHNTEKHAKEALAQLRLTSKQGEGNTDTFQELKVNTLLAVSNACTQKVEKLRYANEAHSVLTSICGHCYVADGDHRLEYMSASVKYQASLKLLNELDPQANWSHLAQRNKEDLLDYLDKFNEVPNRPKNLEKRQHQESADAQKARVAQLEREIQPLLKLADNPANKETIQSKEYADQLRKIADEVMAMNYPDRDHASLVRDIVIAEWKSNNPHARESLERQARWVGDTYQGYRYKMGEILFDIAKDGNGQYAASVWKYANDK